MQCSCGARSAPDGAPCLKAAPERESHIVVGMRSGRRVMRLELMSEMGRKLTLGFAIVQALNNAGKGNSLASPKTLMGRAEPLVFPGFRTSAANPV